MAEYGLRIKHPDTGAVLLNITDRITRVLGTLNTGTANGSYSVDSALGTAFFSCLVANSFDAQSAQPDITVSGNTVSWSFDGAGFYTKVPVTILYGVY